VADDVAHHALELVAFSIHAITPPAEVQKAIVARSSMGAIGDLRAFTMYQAANSMRKMAESRGEASAAMGMGMGAGFGMMLPGFLQQAMQPGSPVAPPPWPGAPATRQPAGPTTAASPTGGMAVDLSALKTIAQDPMSLVRQVADASGWSMRQSGDHWEVTVPVGSLRKQTVRVRFDRTDPDGQSLISFSTVCGPATEQNAMALLRYNAQMAHGAFAVESGEAGEATVIAANQLADTADPLEITRTITALAWQADQVEAKLLGSDEH
jgi:hypothetical protein